jgi:hypothetical protein
MTAQIVRGKTKVAGFDEFHRNALSQVMFGNKMLDWCVFSERI